MNNNKIKKKHNNLNLNMNKLVVRWCYLGIVNSYK